MFRLRCGALIAAPVAALLAPESLRAWVQAAFEAPTQQELREQVIRPPVTAAPAAVALAAADPQPALAEGASDAPTAEELKEVIRAHGAAIGDLLWQVEELKRRLGAVPVAGLLPADARPTFASLTMPPVAEPAQRPAVSVEQAQVEERAPAAPGQFEVDEEAVERALERALVQTGALLLPAGAIEVEPSLTYVRRESDAPFLRREGQEIRDVVANQIERNELEARATLRVGLPFDSQVELGVPFSYEEVSTVTRVGFAAGGERDQHGTGLGDISIALAKGLLREDGWRPDLIGRVRWDSDTGQTDDGVALGSGFHEITGSLTAAKRQDPLVFVGTASYTMAFEDDGIKPGDELGLSLGTVLAASPETSLRFFLAQTFVDDLEVGGREIEGSDQVSTSLLIGASSVIAPRVLLDVTAGIGLTEDAPDYFVSVSLPIRFDLPFRF